MEEVAGLITVQLTTSPEGELLMCINAEPRGRGNNARLTQNRFHKRYSTATKNNYPQIRHILNITACVEHTVCDFFGPF